MIAKEWVQPVDALHKLFRASSDIKDKDGNTLVTAYTVERPDGKWSVLLVNKDKDRDHAVRVRFADTANNQNRFFSGSVDQIVFGAAEYQWHSDGPDTAAVQNNRRHPVTTGHTAPDGPPSKSTVTADGPDTLYTLPKASIIVLRGQIN